MCQQDLPFQVGDQVIHWIYGPGIIIALDEKTLSGNTEKYYVIKTRDLTIWVPLNETAESCLRYPATAEAFQQLIDILSSPVEPLPTDRYERKNLLTDLIKVHSLEVICRLLRDLSYFKQHNKVNDSDNAILSQAKNILRNEWSLALKVTPAQAEGALDALVGNSLKVAG